MAASACWRMWNPPCIAIGMRSPAVEVVVTKHGSEQAFRLAMRLAECRCDPEVITGTLIEFESLCEDDAVRIADQAVLYVLYDRFMTN